MLSHFCARCLPGWSNDMATNNTVTSSVAARQPVIVRRVSQLSGSENRMILVLDLKDLREFESGTHRCIQDVFPYLTAGEREFLLTGIAPAEWNDLFNNCED